MQTCHHEHDLPGLLLRVFAAFQVGLPPRCEPCIRRGVRARGDYVLGALHSLRPLLRRVPCMLPPAPCRSNAGRCGRPSLTLVSTVGQSPFQLLASASVLSPPSLSPHDPQQQIALRADCCSSSGPPAFEGVPSLPRRCVSGHVLRRLAVCRAGTAVPAAEPAGFCRLPASAALADLCQQAGLRILLLPNSGSCLQELIHDAALYVSWHVGNAVPDL
mmetsp:Transcript_146180/g.371069  ORF Transcript_146180/g.371069 Transcript_146180/m.371069 type:complete len:217 (-) Transcript_146180:272-922(-)